MKVSSTRFWILQAFVLVAFSQPALSFGGKGHLPELPTVQDVDLNRYLGTWYEIASFPQSFQRGCTGTTANYSLKKNGEIRVLNTCRVDSLDGKEKSAEGTAWVVDTKTNSKLKVQFFWPFSGDYWIVDLAKDYSYAVVGAPDREYLWFLSRTPTLSNELYARLLSKVAELGFDGSRLVKTLQSGAVFKKSP